MVKPNGPSCWRVSCTVPTSPVTALIRSTGMVLVPMDTPMPMSTRAAFSGMSVPCTVQTAPPGTLTSRVTSRPASVSNTSLSSVVWPVRRAISTVSPSLASSILSTACWLGVLVGLLGVVPPPMYRQFAVIVVSAAGMVKVVLALEAPAKVPPFEEVHPSKR